MERHDLIKITEKTHKGDIKIYINTAGDLIDALYASSHPVSAAIVDELCTNPSIEQELEAFMEWQRDDKPVVVYEILGYEDYARA